MPTERTQILLFLKSVYPFKKMPEANLALLADYLHEKKVDSNQPVFSQDEESNQLFIIFKGKVSLSRSHSGIVENLGTYEEGTVLGYEVWITGQTRLTTATALTDTILFWINWDDLGMLTNKIPLLGFYIPTMLDSYFLTLKTPTDWRSQDEPVYYIGRKHILFFWLRLLPPIGISLAFLPAMTYLYVMQYYDKPLLLLAIVLLAVAMFLWGAYLYLEWSNDDYILTNRRFVVNERVVLLYDSRQEAPLSAILSVSSASDYWGRRFDYGDVTIRTFTGSILINHVPNYDHLLNMIQEKKDKVSAQQAQQEKQSRVDAVRQRLGIGGAKGGPAGASTNLSTSISQETFLQWLASMFTTRFEEGGKITYRTHWIFLLKTIWLPTLIILGLLSLPIIQIFTPFLPLNYLTIIIIVFLTLIPVVLWWLYRYIDWRDDIYMVTDDQLLDISRKPLGKEIKKTAPIINIQSIEYKRIGFIGLVLNYGTVFIRIGDQKFDFDQVHNPSQVQREIFQRLSKRKQLDKQSQMENDRRVILDWLEAYYNAVNQEKPKE